MSDYMVLMGAEDVQRASVTIAQAVRSFEMAVSQMEEVLRRDREERWEQIMAAREGGRP